MPEDKPIEPDEYDRVSRTCPECGGTVIENTKDPIFECAEGCGFNTNNAEDLDQDQEDFERHLDANVDPAADN